MTQGTIARPAPARSAVVPTRPHRWWRDPWRKPRILQTVTWAYLIWSLVPLTIAIAISFNGSRSNSVLHGFSLQWWWSDPEDSLWHDPELHAALFQSLRLGITTVLIAELGTTAQILGLVTYQISYPFIIVRARLLTIGREYEEAATDLGARPRQAIRRVLLPLLYPAIFASAALVFADTIDDFVTVKYLSGPATSEPLSVKIYNFTRAEPTPAVNAAATFLLLTTTFAIVLGYFAYRRATRGQRTGGVSDFANV
jgi:spermidine/putrescine transport system permease protein